MYYIWGEKDPPRECRGREAGSPRGHLPNKRLTSRLVGSTLPICSSCSWRDFPKGTLLAPLSTSSPAPAFLWGVAGQAWTSWLLSLGCACLQRAPPPGAQWHQEFSRTACSCSCTWWVNPSWDSELGGSLLLPVIFQTPNSCLPI